MGNRNVQTAASLRRQIAALRPKAETGEQWAEICRLAVEADRLEQAAIVGVLFGDDEDERPEYPAPHSQFGVGA